MYDVRRTTWATSRSRPSRATPRSSATWPTPEDAAFIQTNIVRVNGRRQVYIPVFRQLGASTLAVVDTLEADAARHEDRS